MSDFRKLTVRTASHAGLVYPSDPEILRKFIDEILSFAPAAEEAAKPVCLVSPHIDYQRGFKGYAFCYRHLQHFKPDCCIVLGTSHKGGQSLFQLTGKDFASPLATLTNDRDFTDQLIAGYGEERSLADELLHKDEHSLELQMPFLAQLCPQTKIVPILVNGFYQYISKGNINGHSEEYEQFISVFTETYKQQAAGGKKILIIAGVDMAHIGQDFGDIFLIDQDIQEQCFLGDKEYLSTFAELASDKMFSHIAKDWDRRRVCGFSTLHSISDMLMKLDEDFTVSIEYYEQSVTNHSRCLVSFAAGKIVKQLI